MNSYFTSCRDYYPKSKAQWLQKIFERHVFCDICLQFSGWRFQIFLLSPLFGEDSHFDYIYILQVIKYFSTGLKPPTSLQFLFSVLQYLKYLKSSHAPGEFRLRIHGGKNDSQKWTPGRVEIVSDTHLSKSNMNTPSNGLA